MKTRKHKNTKIRPKGAYCVIALTVCFCTQLYVMHYQMYECLLQMKSKYSLDWLGVNYKIPFASCELIEHKCFTFSSISKMDQTCPL
jgi:hypothetical protein